MLCSTYVHSYSVYKTYGYREELIEWWKGREKAKIVSQCQLIEGVPNVGGMAYKKQVVDYTQEPYTFRYSPPTDDTITGIACTPVDAETQSPEAEVLDGGVNYNHVTVRLTPVMEGKWACDVVIFTKPS